MDKQVEHFRSYMYNYKCFVYERIDVVEITVNKQLNLIQYLKTNKELKKKML